MLNPLKLKRLEKGFTQFELSLKAKVPPPYISLAERGYPILRQDHKERIARILRSEIGKLFPGAG